MRSREPTSATSPSAGAQAEYHAQRPKVRAYAILVRSGWTPKQAVVAFRNLLTEIRKGDPA